MEREISALLFSPYAWRHWRSRDAGIQYCRSRSQGILRYWGTDVVLPPIGAGEGFRHGGLALDNQIHSWRSLADDGTQQRHHITTVYSEARMRLLRQSHRRRFSFSDPVRSVLDRVSSSTSVPYIVHGHSQRKAGRRLSSTTTLRPYLQTLILQTSFTSSR